MGKRTLKCKVTVKEPNKSKRLNLAKKEAKKIVKKYVAADLNAKERAFVLFRYLTEHCSWQLNQSSEAYQKNYGNEAYAALVMKKAACSGYAKELHTNEDKTYRALALSNLIAIHQKTGIGRLSAYCGAVSAGAAAGAGIAYLCGGGYEEVIHTVVNALAIVSGMVCDGAKLPVQPKSQLP